MVFGAGVTGLSMAWKMTEAGLPVTVLEKQSFLGGTAGTFTHGEYKLDFGPHKIYTQLDHIHKELQDLLGEDMKPIPKKSRIYMLGKYFDYPFKMTALMMGINPVLAAKAMASYAAAKFQKKDDTTYESYLVSRFGRTLYELVFKPYAEKVWGDPSKLDGELARIRVVVPSLGELVKRMIIGDSNKKEISARNFYYPKNGCAELSYKMAERAQKAGCRIETTALPSKVHVKGNRVTSVDYVQKGKTTSVNVSYLASTIYLNDLIPMMDPKPPQEVLTAAASLKYRSLILFFVVVEKERLFQDNWIFFADKGVIFNRASEQKGFSESMIPKGKTVLCVEITCMEGDGKWSATTEQLYERVIADLEKVDLVKRGEVKEYFTLKWKNKYPMYDLHYKKNLATVLAYLDQFENLITNGRPGLLNYNNMDHCIDMGLTATEHIVKGGDGAAWKEARRKFDSYQIID